MPNPTVVFYEPGAQPTRMQPGDFILTRNQARWWTRNGFVDAGIRTVERWAQWRAKVPKEQRDEMARWSHAVAVSDGHLVEALGVGVVRSPLDKYGPQEFLYVHTDLSDGEREAAVAIWEFHVGDRYGWFIDVSIALSLWTRWQFKRAGTEICSGLVAAGLGVYAWATDPSFVRPDQLAAYHGIDGHAVIGS